MFVVLHLELSLIKFFQYRLSLDHLSRMSGRAADTNQAEVTPKRQKSAVTNSSPSSNDDQRHFDDLFAVLVNDLHSFSSEHGDVADALQWFKRVCFLVLNVALLLDKRGSLFCPQSFI